MSKNARVRLEHRAFGSAIVRRSRYTDTGTAVFDVRFEDGKDRTVLAAAEFWLSSQTEVEKAFADSLESKPEVAVPQGPRAKRIDTSVPQPVYEGSDDIPPPYEFTHEEPGTETAE